MSELAVVLAACRTPIGSFGGRLKDASAGDLGALVIHHALDRAGVKPEEVDDAIMGCVLQAGTGMNVARQAAIKAGIPAAVPAETVNRVCGSGLQAVVHAVEASRSGYSRVLVAGGTESMSNAPFLLHGARWGHRLGHGTVTDVILSDGLTCAIENCHMGMTAEEIATRFHVSREQQDAFSAESQRRAHAAISGGAFVNEIVPVDVPGKKGQTTRVEVDEFPKPDTSLEKLAALRPAFMSTGGSVTAGNASGINDGAAALVVATPEYASTSGKAPLARILSYACAGVDPRIMGMGAAAAARKALERAGLGVDEIDLFELNEAFAAQAVAVVRDLGADPAKVNVNGGAIALGHPIGASGARILTTLIYALRARQGGRGLASLCIGGGMGIAMTIEVAPA